MTTIGTFTQREDGAFHGSIRTLALHLKGVQVRPVERTAERGPDHIVSAGDIEIGAAWSARSEDGGRLTLRLDDPSFPAPVHALLVPHRDKYVLKWMRRRRGA